MSEELTLLERFEGINMKVFNENDQLRKVITVLDELILKQEKTIKDLRIDVAYLQLKLKTIQTASQDLKEHSDLSKSVLDRSEEIYQNVPTATDSSV